VRKFSWWESAGPSRSSIGPARARDQVGSRLAAHAAGHWSGVKLPHDQHDVRQFPVGIRRAQLVQHWTGTGSGPRGSRLAAHAAGLWSGVNLPHDQRNSRQFPVGIRRAQLVQRTGTGPGPKGSRLAAHAARHRPRVKLPLSQAWFSFPTPPFPLTHPRTTPPTRRPSVVNAVSRKQATGAVARGQAVSHKSKESVRCQLMIDLGLSTRQAKLPQSKSSSPSQRGTNWLRSPNGALHQQACHTSIPLNAGVHVEIV
jgi:hypothetical protein